MSPTTIATQLKFTFVDAPHAHHTDTEPSVSAEDPTADMDQTIFTAHDLQTSILDTIRRYYGSSTVEHAMRMYENQKNNIEINRDEDYEAPNIFEKMVEESPSVHKTRMISNYLNTLDTRTIVLHRKRFFDDQFEKLIIMAVQLRYYQKDTHE